MLDLRQLEEWLKDWEEILIDLNISLKNAKFLQATPETMAINSALGLGFFDHHWYQLRFIMIVQLAKFFSNSNNSHKRNVYKLLNKLKEGDYDECLIEKLKQNQHKDSNVFKSKEDIEKSVNRILRKLKNKTNLLEKLRSNRDKVYAHTDPNRNEVKYIKLNELKKLIHFAGYIYNEIYGKLNDTHRIFVQTGYEVSSIVYCVAEEFERRESLKNNQQIF